MKVFYIEDNPLDIDLTRRAFKKAASQIELDTANSQKAALKKIMAPDFAQYDIVLTDMNLPDGDGIAILSHIRAHSIPVPVVLLTGQGDESAAVAALKAGADDYVVKKRGYLDLLPQLLETAFSSYRESKQRELRAIRTLYVEHHLSDVDLTRRHLAKQAPHIQMTAIPTVSEFHKLLDTPDGIAAYDVLLLDYRLPQENALEILKQLRAGPCSQIPVILITGKGDEEIAVKAMKLGAFDYVTKDQGYLFKLPSVIENAYYSTQLACEHAALLESEERYRSLFENNHVVMLLVDPATGEIVDVNPAAVRFYGWPRGEMIAKNTYEINTLTPDAVQQEMAAALAEKRNHFVFKHRRSDGSICDVEVYASPIHVGGRPLLFSTVYDISQRIKMRKEKETLQHQLIQAQKMEAIGQLAGGIAHDFNNILSSIIGFTELSLDEIEKGSDLEDNLQEVYVAGKRAKDLVGQILAFARQSAGEKQPVLIHKVASEVIKFIRPMIPTTIDIKTAINSKSAVLGNETQVHQILMNLCSNAAQALEHDGGVLEIAVNEEAVATGSTIAQLGLASGEYVVTRVSDTGPGIPPEIIESIFQPYFTTKKPEEGTGMGLAVVHGIVESYGGKITVESTPGQGAVFTVYLPITREQKTHQPYELASLPSGIERILLVDDEASIAKMGDQTLSRLGYAVTTRTSSLEALALFRAKPEDFDLVITDMTMPNMTGDKLAAELMKIRPDIPIILCTGYSKKISDETAATIGIKAFAYKPMVKADLAKTIRKVLDAVYSGAKNA